MFPDQNKSREGNRREASFLPHQITRQEQCHGLETAFRKRVGLRDALFNERRGIEEGIRNVHRAKQWLGDGATLRLPGIALAKRAPRTNERQQRNFATYAKHNTTLLVAA